jgi:hypothetical protein
MSAPERIWADIAPGHECAGYWGVKPLPRSSDTEYLRADIAATRVAELVEALRALVTQNEQWNEAVIRVTGRPANWTDEYLSKARALIAKYGDKT